MENKKKKVLILTADAGYGHRSAAKAVFQALEEMYNEFLEIEIVNPLDDKRTPFFLRDSQKDYDKWVKDVPELYKFGYDASDGRVSKSIMESILIVSLYEVIKDVIEIRKSGHYRYDVSFLSSAGSCCSRDYELSYSGSHYIDRFSISSSYLV